jgi:hypothetical protein
LLVVAAVDQIKRQDMEKVVVLVVLMLVVEMVYTLEMLYMD